MNLLPFFKAALDEDKAPVVICDLEHTIIYMNPVACQRYEKQGGADLLGKSLLDCHNAKSNEMINRVLDWFMASADNNRIFTFRNEKENKDVYMVALRDDSGKLIGYYEKHEYRNHETTERYLFTR
ncbi:MAG: PAS domain-containing protein [Oscillospiraceae bacterium]|nr:PAS domain-containing protein [Oscillospiraceae bacterium]